MWNFEVQGSGLRNDGQACDKSEVSTDHLGNHRINILYSHQIGGINSTILVLWLCKWSKMTVKAYENNIYSFKYTQLYINNT